MRPGKEKRGGKQCGEAKVDMPCEKAETKKESEEIPISPFGFATAPDQAQCFPHEQENENHAERLRSDTVGERIEKRIARPDQGQHEADPKKLADADDKIIGAATQSQVLGQDQQPDTGIGQTRRGRIRLAVRRGFSS